MDCGAAIGIPLGVLPIVAGGPEKRFPMWWGLRSLRLRFIFGWVCNGLLRQQTLNERCNHIWMSIYDMMKYLDAPPSKVQRVSWWMAHYGAPTPKRHYAFGNTSMILALDRGVLRKWKPSPGQKVVTAERYLDKSGKMRYKGTPKLRTTENLGSSKFKSYSSPNFFYLGKWNRIE